jgi:hypothetical protein
MGEEEAYAVADDLGLPPDRLGLLVKKDNKKGFKRDTRLFFPEPDLGSQDHVTLNIGEIIVCRNRGCMQYPTDVHPQHKHIHYNRRMIIITRQEMKDMLPTLQRWADGEDIEDIGEENYDEDWWKEEGVPVGRKDKKDRPFW